MCGSCCMEGRDEIVLRLTPPKEPGGDGKFKEKVRNLYSHKKFTSKAKPKRKLIRRLKKEDSDLRKEVEAKNKQKIPTLTG